MNFSVRNVAQQLRFYQQCVKKWSWGAFIFLNIVQTPFILKGGVDFKHLPLRGGIWKFFKKGWKHGAGTGFLKRGGWHFSYLIFKNLSFLHLEITLPFAKLCYAFEDKIFFSATKILWKKVTLSCLKMNLKVSHRLR